MATNILDLVSHVQQQGALGRQQGMERKRHRTLSEFMQPAIGGDKDALSQVYGVDVDAGMKAQGAAQTQAASADEQRNKRLLQLARVLNAAPEQMKPQIYASMVPEFSQMGLPQVPPEYTPEVGQMAAKMAQAWAGADEEQPRIVAPGSAIVGNDGRVIYERPFAPANASVINVPDGLGGTVQMLFDPKTRELSEPQYPGQKQQQPAQAAPRGADVMGDAFRGAMAPQEVQELVKSLAGQYGGQVSSLQRSPADNRRVGGVDNSQHMRGTAGDVVVPQPQRAAFMAAARAQGLEAIDEGDHVHLELPPQSAQAGRMGHTPPKSLSAQGDKAANWQVIQGNDGQFYRFNKLTGQTEAAGVVGNNAARIQKLEAERVGKVQAFEGGITMTKDAIGTIDNLLASSGLESAVGMNSYLPSRRGGAAYTFERQLDTFKSQTFVPMVAQLKGMGALSDAEAKKLSDAVGALDVGMDEAAFKRSLQDIKSRLTAAMTAANRKIAETNSAYSQQYKGQPAPAQGGGSDIDSILDKYR